MEERILEYQKILKIGWLNLAYKKVQRDGVTGWVAVTENDVEIGPFCTPQTKAKLKAMLSTRYLADVYTDSAHVNLRWAMNNPRFSRKGAALDELKSRLLLHLKISENKEN